MNVTNSRKTCNDHFLLINQEKWPTSISTSVYVAGLAYCFIGLTIASSLFMNALETIMKQTRMVTQKDPLSGLQVARRERVWNLAVADVTLLALGTSFPQISLALIDAFKNLGQLSDSGLGPGTLVGSAAFNDFVILSVCVLVPNNGQIKRIENVAIYLVELVWSFWAYIWLFLILKVWTPNMVSLWEAIITMIQFPILILHVFLQDKRNQWIDISNHSSQLPLDADIAIIAVELKEASAMSNTSLIPMFQLEQKQQEQHLLPVENGLVFTKHYGDSMEESLSSTWASDFQKESFDGVELDEKEASEDLGWTELFFLWKQQLLEAITVKSYSDSNGKDLQQLSVDLLLHVVSSPWRLIFALIPPAAIFHGWLTFACTLSFITGISYIVVALANQLECLTGISTYVIAFTLLATGTSIPTLMASKIATERQEGADSAISNINASNCINIFVGIGLPWFIAAVYNKTSSDKEFLVPATGLGVTLIVYFATFILCIGVLYARRYFIGGEFGGPQGWAWACSGFFFILWLIFLFFSCLKALQ